MASLAPAQAEVGVVAKAEQKIRTNTVSSGLYNLPRTLKTHHTHSACTLNQIGVNNPRKIAKEQMQGTKYRE